VTRTCQLLKHDRHVAAHQTVTNVKNPQRSVRRCQRLNIKSRQRGCVQRLLPTATGKPHDQKDFQKMSQEHVVTTEELFEGSVMRVKNRARSGGVACGHEYPHEDAGRSTLGKSRTSTCSVPCVQPRENKLECAERCYLTESLGRQTESCPTRYEPGAWGENPTRNEPGGVLRLGVGLPGGGGQARGDLAPGKRPPC